MDGSTGFELFLMGQEHDLREMGRQTAEPWNQPKLRVSGEHRKEPRKKEGFLLRLNRRFEQQHVPCACCFET